MRGVKTNTNGNIITIRKNKFLSLLILALSIIAECFFYFILFKNISAGKDQAKHSETVILLFAISFIFLVFLVLSVRFYLVDKNYRIEIEGKNVIVNGRKFERNKIDLVVTKVGNRWGTMTYNVSLKGNGVTVRIAYGIDKSDKEYLVKYLSEFLGIPEHLEG